MAVPNFGPPECRPKPCTQSSAFADKSPFFFPPACCGCAEAGNPRSARALNRRVARKRWLSVHVGAPSDVTNLSRETA